MRTYFTVTDLVAEPPRLLRTVMLCGFTDQENWPAYAPPPLLESVRINAPLAETYALSAAEELVLVASTRSVRLSLLYSARVIDTLEVFRLTLVKLSLLARTRH